MVYFTVETEIFFRKPFAICVFSSVQAIVLCNFFYSVFIRSLVLRLNWYRRQTSEGFYTFLCHFLVNLTSYRILIRRTFLFYSLTIHLIHYSESVCLIELNKLWPSRWSTGKCDSLHGRRKFFIYSTEGVQDALFRMERRLINI